MNNFERRLADLLHTGTPEPDRIITASMVAELAQDGLTPNGRRVHRWGVPLMAAAAVLAAVAVPVFVIGRTVNSDTPTSPSPSAQTSAPTTSSPSSTASITNGPIATCLTSQLSLTVGSREGAAGSSYATFYLTNTTGTPCTVHGFPGVSLLNDAGNIVGQPATRDGSEGPSVRLGPGQRAQFTLRVSTATQTGCDLPRPSSQVQVYPPDQRGPLRMAFITASCSMLVQSLTAAP